MTFGYLETLYVRVCEINNHRHTCDEYLILFTKSGMTSITGDATASLPTVTSLPIVATAGSSGASASHTFVTTSVGWLILPCMLQLCCNTIC
jgi:hypothetical protein